MNDALPGRHFDNARIAIISGHHVCNNPRVLKEADALAAAGYEVVVLGIRRDAELSRRDAELMRSRAWRYEPALDFMSRGFAGVWQRWSSRAASRAAAWAFRWFGLESPRQLGCAAARLWKRARALRADLYIAHLEQGMWAAERLLDQGCRVGADIEDWYSEDLPAASRARRPQRLLRRLEARLLHDSAYTTCTSQAMSQALASAYGCRPPAVVYNVFPVAERRLLDGKHLDRIDLETPSIYWFSQTLGVDRGLQDLIAALPLLCRPAQLHLRGGCADRERWVRDHVPEQYRSWVRVHAPVANDLLLSRIVEHDIGFAGEQPFCLNKDLTASNKVFHYVLGGLAVAASDTQGQREALAQMPGAGKLYTPGDPTSLAGALNGWLADPQQLARAKQAAFEASKRFCWEVESRVLLAAVARALGRETRTSSEHEFQHVGGSAG